MATTIESLEVQIQTNSTSAVSGIDALTAALTKLQTVTKGGLGLRSIANQLGGINTTLGQMSADSTSKLSNLATALSGLSGFKVGGLGTAIKYLANLPSALTGLADVDLTPIINNLNQLNAALQPIATNLSPLITAINKLPTVINQASKASATYAVQNNVLATSFTELASKAKVFMGIIQRVGNLIISSVSASAQYIESYNLFSVSMGDAAESAYEYAQAAEQALGIDSGEFMKNQGVFNTIIKGFGVSADKAALMSQQLTQLGYDISAFNNVSVSDAMLKLQSGIAGELEPLRRIGYDLSVARLQQEAYALGIDKSISEMTQAEKSMLRYNTILTQVTDNQGALARELDSPTNQLRVLRAQINMAARAFGNVFLPVLSAVAPYAIAAAKALRWLAECVASLFGFQLADFTDAFESAEDSLSGLGGYASDATDGLDDATAAAKKLKNATLGIDELNIISKDEDSGSGSGATAGGGGAGFDFELPTYEFFENIKVDEIFENLKSTLLEIRPIIAAIGAGLAAWYIASSVTKGIEAIKSLGSFKLPSLGNLSGLFTGLSFGGMIAELNEFRKYFEDFLNNGATFDNVVGMLHSFAGALGFAMLAFGNIKTGSALLVISGVAKIVQACKSISKGGVNWENVSLAIKGIGLVIAGISLWTGNLSLGAVGVTIYALGNLIPEIKKIIDAFKTGDWSDVSWSTVAINAILAIGGMIFAIMKVKKTIETAGASKGALDTLSDTTKGLSDGTGTLSTNTNTLGTKMKDLATNMGWGVLIIAEVAAAAIIFVGAIAVIGYELQAVVDAWTPVLENGGTCVIAIGLGAAMMAAIGVVCATLGKSGSQLIIDMGIGIAVLAETGVATGLFLVEIWAIGLALQEIYEAWKPIMGDTTCAEAIGLGTLILVAVGVAAGALGAATIATGGTIAVAIALGTAMLLELGLAAGVFIVEVEKIGEYLQDVYVAWYPITQNDTVATAIETGTALLVGVGIATAALGAASVASVGLLPVAIALGTTLLVSLAESVQEFIVAIADVAKKIIEELAPELEKFTPDVAEDMETFTDYMTQFAEAVVKYTEVSAISGLAGLIDTIIGFFTQDPIDKLADEVEKVQSQCNTLNDKLEVANPDLEEAIDLLTSYRDFLTELEELTTGEWNISDGMFVNMEEVGENLVTGFTTGISNKTSEFSSAASTIVTGFTTQLTTSAATCQTSITTWAGNIKTWFTADASGAVNATTFGKYAKDIVNAFKTTMTANYSLSKTAITTWGTSVLQWFDDAGGNVAKWAKIAKDMVEAATTGIESNYNNMKSSITTWANSVLQWFQYPNGTSLTTQMKDVGKALIQGFIDGSSDSVLWARAKRKIREFAEEIIDAAKDELDVHSPSRIFLGIGENVVEGFNMGIQGMMGSSYSTMTQWANGLTGFSPQLAMAVDTSAIGNVSAPTLSTMALGEVQSTYSVQNEGMAESIEEWYRAYVEPLFREMADDMKRQADKSEQTVIKLGNQTLAKAITSQQKANGYSFIK